MENVVRKTRHALEAMEGDSEKTKILYFHHWVDSGGMAQIESWKNNKTLSSQEDYEKLEETQREGKYSLDRIESYFTLFESLLAPRSNPLLAVKELYFTKQGSMNSGEFHAPVVKIVKRVYPSWIPTLLSTLLHTTVDRTRPRTAKRTEEMERIRDSINLESKDLLILDISLENP